MDYKNYSVEDFVLDPRFRKWILSPNAEDHIFWEEWLKEHPELAGSVHEARLLVLRLPKMNYSFSALEKNALWASIDHDIETSHSEEKRSHDNRLSKVVPLNSGTVTQRAKNLRDEAGHKRVWWNWRIAAAIAFLIAFGLMFYFMANRGPVLEQHKEACILKQNPLGQKSTIYLSDGSVVVLNAGSTLRYKKNFAQGERVVLLKGEAYFNVAKDLKRPFKVISGNIATTALGTAFNVSAYSEGKTIEVSLVEGKVAVRALENGDDEIILRPGEQAVYQPGSFAFAKGTFDPENVIAWKDGIIHFSGASESKVFHYLEQWYGVHFNIENASVKHWNYSGHFNNMDLKTVLRSIGYSMNFEFVIRDDSVDIRYVKG